MFNKVVTMISADVDAEIPKRDGGSYRGALLVYTNDRGQVEQKGIHTAVLKDDMKAKIENLKKDQKAVLCLNKNDRGFYDLLDIVTDEEAVTKAASAPKRAYSKYSGGSNNSRMSSDQYTRAQALVAASNITSTLAETVETANVFVEYIKSGAADVTDASGAPEATKDDMAMPF